MVEEHHPSTDAVQLALLRSWTPARRLALMFSLSDMAIRLSRRALRRARPDATEDELRAAFVEAHYGPELAKRFRTRQARGR